jgi:hypothetical protein
MKFETVRTLVVFSIVLTALFGTAVMAQDEPPPVLGAVNIVVPELHMTLTDGSETRLIAPSVFDPGEILTADANGVGVITWFYDGTETVVGQNSTLKLNNFSGAADGDFVVDLELSAGHVVAGLGYLAGVSENGSWTLKTPAFTIKLLSGEIDVMVAGDGTTTLVVTEGRAEALVEGGDTFTVDENQFLVGGPSAAPGGPQALSSDGMTVNLSGVCTVSPTANLNVRLAPGEDSRRLGGAKSGQALWVRSSTEGNLWLQVYYHTAPDDEEGHNFGWIYGPAGALDAANCGAILRAPLDAVLYGGQGVDQPTGTEGETEPISS